MYQIFTIIFIFCFAYLINLEMYYHFVFTVIFHMRHSFLQLWPCRCLLSRNYSENLSYVNKKIITKYRVFLLPFLPHVLILSFQCRSCWTEKCSVVAELNAQSSSISPLTLMMLFLCVVAWSFAQYCHSQCVVVVVVIVRALTIHSHFVHLIIIVQIN